MSSNKSFSSETSERYARALFELAQEKSELDVTEQNIRDFLKIYNESKELENFIKNPTQSFNNQLAIIKKISDLMKFTKNLERFFSILIIKRRIFFSKKILISFLKLASLKRGELSAQLISSKELSSQDLKNISSELSKIIGSNINFNYKVDENLIGGFKMQLGSLMIDTSIKNKLRKYKQLMMDN